MSEMQQSRDLWQRWHMGELHRAAQPQALANAEAAAEHSEQELQQAHLLEQLKEAARQKGFAQGKSEGHQAGFAEGREQGHAEGLRLGRLEAEQELQRQLADTIAPLRTLIAGFEQALRQLDEEVAQQLAALAMTAARHLARRDLDLHPDHVVALVRELLQTQPLCGEPKLWLAPADLPLVQQHLAEELAAAGWQLRPDPTLTRGGCRLTSNTGEIDASWETRCQTLVEQYWSVPAVENPQAPKPKRTRARKAKVATTTVEEPQQ